MPIHEFLCPECGEKKEELVYDVSEPVTCDNCGTLMNRLVSAPAGFDLVGEGFYGKHR